MKRFVEGEGERKACLLPSFLTTPYLKTIRCGRSPLDKPQHEIGGQDGKNRGYREARQPLQQWRHMTP